MLGVRFRVEDILKITDGELLVNKDVTGSFFISTDSRNISCDQIFLPLTGSNFNGTDFIESSLNKGCKGFFIDRKNIEKIKNFSFETKADFAILVNDTLIAYLSLASYKRDIIKPKVVGVTGSSGKTTVKEIIFSTLSQKYKTNKSILNHNNEIGLCQTLLNLDEGCEYVVIEMGMRGLGEIELLSKYSRPDISIITNIGNAHIGRLGSIENIAKAKSEIVKHMSQDGILISHNSPLVKNALKDWHGNSIYYDLNKNVEIKSLSSNHSEFLYKGLNYKLNVSGKNNILNAIASIETAVYSGMEHKEIYRGLLSYKQIDHRWKIEEINGAKIIDDSYNANPESVKAAIDNVVDSYSESKIFLVLGDMAELGQYETELHAEIGKYIQDKNIYRLLTLGNKAEITAKNASAHTKTKAFINKQEIVKYLRENLDKNSVVLLKASRCMSLEKIIEDLKETS